MVALVLLTVSVNANQLTLLFYGVMAETSEYRDYGLSHEDWQAFREIQQTERYKSYVADASPLYVLGVEALWRGDAANAERYAKALADYQYRDAENTLVFMRLMMRHTDGRVLFRPKLAATDRLVVTIDLDCQRCALYQTALELHEQGVALSLILNSDDEAQITAWAQNQGLEQTDNLYLYPAAAKPAELANASLYRINAQGKPTCLSGACLQP